MFYNLFFDDEGDYNENGYERMKNIFDLEELKDFVQKSV